MITPFYPSGCFMSPHISHEGKFHTDSTDRHRQPCGKLMRSKVCEVPLDLQMKKDKRKELIFVKS